MIRDIIPFRKLTGDHFGGNLGIISGSRDYFGGSKIARKWYSLALSSLPRSMIPGGTIRSLHQSRLTLVALATINLLLPLSLIPPLPLSLGRKLLSPAVFQDPLNGKLYYKCNTSDRLILYCFLTWWKLGFVFDGWLHDLQLHVPGLFYLNVLGKNEPLRSSKEDSRPQIETRLCLFQLNVGKLQRILLPATNSCPLWLAQPRQVPRLIGC